MKLSRRIRLGVLVLALAALGAGRFVESRRLAVPLARSAGPPVPARLDAEQMQLDLQVLASERLEGRATGTTGGQLAAQLVESRFRDLGLATLNGSFVQPFTFVHRSIRALWRRNRPFTKDFAGARNVVGYVRGTSRPDDIIVVSAHFDHLGVLDGQVYHGADDNASGTAALLAIARYVQVHPQTRSVLFAAFDAEELGLRGSRAFVEQLPFARERLRLDVNIDMIGRSDDGRLFAAGVEQTPALREIVAAAAATSPVPVHLGHDRPMYLTGLIADWTHASDQGAFHDIGVPFLYFGVEDHEDVHQPTDTADRIDRAFYAGAAETVLSAVLAADAKLP
jgi:Zn-dependent M28 family amino/carboxypeptidase